MSDKKVGMSVYYDGNGFAVDLTGDTGDLLVAFTVAAVELCKELNCTPARLAELLPGACASVGGCLSKMHSVKIDLAEFERQRGCGDGGI